MWVINWISFHTFSTLFFFSKKFREVRKNDLDTFGDRFEGLAAPLRSMFMCLSLRNISISTHMLVVSLINFASKETFKCIVIPFTSE